MAHLFFVDTAVATEAYGQPNNTTRTYIPYNLIKDPRDYRQIPLEATPDATTGAALLTDLPDYFASEAIITDVFRLCDLAFYPSDLVSAEDLETVLTEMTGISYVPESLVRTGEIEVALARFEPNNLTVKMPKFVSFKVLIDEAETTFNVWFDNAYMIQNFLDTIITVIIPPMPLADLYVQNTLAKTKTDLANAAASAAYVAKQVATSVGKNDETGIATLVVKYFSGSDAYVEIPFSLLYCGHTPGTITMQQAIKKFLLDSGVGDEDGWAERIPSLFVAATYYVVPFWDNTTTYGSRTFHPSHIPLAWISDRLSRTMYDLQTMMQHATVISTAYDCLISGILPDANNVTDHRDFTAEHPTYQDFSSTTPNFAYMEADTQKFSTHLVGALAVAAGVSSDPYYEFVQMEDRQFVTFVVGGLAFYVLNKETYTTLVA